MFGRDGKISVLRVGTFIGVVGFILIGGGLLSFFFDQASRQSPLEIAPFPGVESMGQRTTGGTSRFVYYRIATAPGATAEDVEAYYQQKMNEHYGNSEEDCLRFPPAPGETLPGANQPGVVPYYFKCMFDRSGFRSTQYTVVTIYPGVFNPDPALNTEGFTVIENEQVWQP